MRINFVTLFPEQVLGALAHSIIGRGVERGLLEFVAVNPRDFTTDKHRTVDDTPYGGGPGMVMKPEPIHAALLSLGLEPGNDIVLMPDPTGVLFTQVRAIQLGGPSSVTILCGHYEGIDDRIATHWKAEKLSIGDYILSGGEFAALVIADAICRNVPGILGCAESLDIDSFGDGLLSAPQFTRPEVWNELAVPEVLTTGDHGAIGKWKRRESLQLTLKQRPDLFSKARLDKNDVNLLSS
ncbi:MAG: tRNA (guanosine(37)-N1)-methyltransferase TrmD [Fimbriimonadaceae bacterium]